MPHYEAVYEVIERRGCLGLLLGMKSNTTVEYRENVGGRSLDEAMEKASELRGELKKLSNGTGDYRLIRVRVRTVKQT